MKDLFGGVQKSLASFAQIWLLSAIVCVGLWSFFLFPIASGEGGIEPFISVAALGSTEEVFAGAFTALGLALFYSVVSTGAYRLLEGYYWPRSIRRTFSARQRKKRAKLRQKPTGQTRISLAERHARLEGFPRNPDKIMPTRLGNSLRAAETYGSETYGINTVAWWHQLLSVTDEPLREQLTESRNAMDFVMGVFLSAPVFALASAWVAIGTGNDSAWWGLVSLASMPLSYRGVVAASRVYGGSVRAITDVSRHALAERLGITIPDSLEKEQTLWSAYSQYIEWGNGWKAAQTWREIIDQHRMPKAPDDEAADATPPTPPVPVLKAEGPIEVSIVRSWAFRRLR